MTKIRIAAALTACLLPTLAGAQDSASTILVLDGSGSMWGQIDGTAKITIAQEAVGDLLSSLPDGQSIGLTAYGHRVKGDCGDIETLVAPGGDTRDAIARAVMAIKPKGRTPLTNAVLQAAETLRYTENKATVILVSDGRETCEADPCAIGRMLEETGVDFTAHVVGFDVEDDPDARRDLQCLADETGGSFVLASDAASLTTALTQISQEPPTPEPAALPQQLTLRVTEGDGGPTIRDGVVWTITDSAGETVRDEAPHSKRDLMPGDYVVSVLRIEDEAFDERRITIADQSVTVTMVLPERALEATVSGPQTALQGETIQVSWTGPNKKGDLIGIANPALSDRPIKRVPVEAGNPVDLRLPAQPGQYELRYYLGQGMKPLASQSIEVLPAEITLTAPSEAEIGSTIEIAWTGPAFEGDFIGVKETGGDVWAINKISVSEGSPLRLRMPGTSGSYELRYQLAEEQAVAYSQPITITEAQIGLDAPAEAEIGETIEITWTGPGNPGDFISVKEADGDVWGINKAATKDGNPVRLRMPGTPGEYELRYQLAEEQQIVYRQPITITEAQIGLDAPAEAEIGSTIEITWTGPGNPGDFISVKEAGGDVWGINKAATKDGNPVRLRMPGFPGDYELRYQLAEEQQIVYRRPITITEAQISLTAPSEAEIGETIEVTWDGPGNAGDFIGVKDTGGDVWAINKAATRKGNPARLRMPSSPGTYEIRYQLAEEQIVVHSVEITIVAPVVELNAPASAQAGSEIEFDWTGPANAGDFISVHVVGGDVWAMHKVPAKPGTPTRLKMPDAPGDYEIRYQLAEEQAVIARRHIMITE